MTTAISKVRDAITDNLKTATPDFFEYTNLNIFNLTEQNVDSSTIVVYKNGTELDSGDWSYNSSTGKIIIAGLSVGDQIEIRYSCYKKYSDNELKGFIRNALTKISINRYKTFTVDTRNNIKCGIANLSEQEYNLIADVASILIDGGIKSYRTPEITINFTENESKDEKIRKIVLNFIDRLGDIDWLSLGEEEEYE